jgi:hypothetical protein
MRSYQLAALLGFAAALSQTSPAAPSFSGTYRIAVCKSEPCSVDDVTNAVVHGYVVLNDAPIDPSTVPSDAASRLRRNSVIPSWNACFALNGSSGIARTYAGIGGAAFTVWSIIDSTRGIVQFRLFQSPDSNHTTRATLTGPDLRGVGTSFGAGVAARMERGAMT